MPLYLLAVLAGMATGAAAGAALSAISAIQRAIALVSFLLAFAITTRLLRYRQSREGAD